MEFSDDDEGEFVAQSVTDYHFLDEKEVLVSFTVLPIQWGGDSDGILEPFEGQVFLRGTADNGLQKIFKQVIAWRFELVDEIPDISVFSKEKTWIRLEKPRKSFEYVIRGVLITLHCLGFVKKDSQISGRLLWENLRRVFSTYEVRPCEDDLKHHHLLISEAVKRYDVLSKSKFLLTLLENVRKRKTLIEHLHSPSSIKKSKFLVDEDEDDSDKDVCAICDNGGALVCCDGRCLRSFHGTEADGRKSKCESLGLSEAQLEGNFMCPNCRYKQHQCYACGRLGSSDKNFRLEVFPCVSATCGHYYHPKCVAKLLHPNPRDEPTRQALQNKIGAGEPFTCPAHRCHACKKSENLDVKDLCFALCRRCPKAYHRRCLHRNIAFQSVKDQGIIRRAWDGLLPNRRVMIYCLKHDIDQSLQTPFRNIIFPEGPEQTLNSLSRKRRIVKKKKFVLLENLCSENIVPKKRKHDLKGFDINDGSNRMPESLSGEGLDSKLNVVSKQPIINNHKQSKKLCAVDATGALIGEDGSLLEEPELVKCNPQNESSSKSEEHNMLLEKEECSSSSSLDSELKEKLLALMRDVAPTVTSDVVKNHLVPSTCTLPSKALVDRTIRLGRVNNYVEAAQIALQMLEVGCSIEEAKAICGPESLNQLLDSRNKLKVYLAPFLHGTSYTSFGRHFTKVDKLKEIVDKLHWYVKNDDVIVDFCCGANDFSWLIKEKLYESGKNCCFKNYDIIQPKNDFGFEKRDWMSVRQAELPAGSKLIMGLSPPFGLKAAVANKFIDRALEFEPKLLILIVPEETERLDKKKSAYDLIWEDGDIFSGKSFYLPGSEDACDYEMEQLNVKPPRLYLWSRSDWTTEHISIAHEHGHLSKDVVEEHEDLYEAELNHPFDASPNHMEPVEFIEVTREHCEDCEITVQTNGLLEENDEEKVEENESTAPLKCAAELNHPIAVSSNHKEPVDIFEFTREHCDTTVQTNCLLEENDEEKIEETESTTPLNGTDEISLPKYSKCNVLGGVETKEDTNPSVISKSPKKQMNKNDEKQSEKETSSVPISCKKSSSPPSSNKHGGVDTKDLVDHSVRNLVLKKKNKNKRKKFEEEKSAVPNFFNNRSLHKDAKRSKRAGYDANDYNDHGVLRNSLKKSKGHMRGKQSRRSGRIRLRGQNDCNCSQDAKLPFRVPRHRSMYSWADAETLPGGYPREAYWSPHGTSHTFSNNEMGRRRVRTSNQGDDFDEGPWNYSAAYASGRHEWSDGLLGGHPQEACRSASPRRASGIVNEVGYKRARTRSQGDDIDVDRASKKRTPSASKRGEWSAGKSGGRKKYGARGSYGGTHGRSEFDERNERSDEQQHYQNYDLQNDYYYSAERRYPHDPRDDRFGALDDSLSSTPRDDRFGVLDDSLSSTPYSVQGLVSNSGYGRMSFSAIDKYAPQLDELNRRRMDFYEPEMVRGRSSMFEGYGSHYPHEGYHGRQPYPYRHSFSGGQ